MFASFLLIILGAILICFIYILIRPQLNGAVYFTTTSENLDIILRLADVKSGERVCDLGSGDGRVLIACARRGAEAHGYEIDPWLVWKSRRVIKSADLAHSAIVHWKSFWTADLSLFDVVVVYGTPRIMDKLSRKFEMELKPGTRVVSNIYPVSGWQAKIMEKKVYLYVI